MKGEERDVEFVHVIANEPLELRKGAKQGDPFKVTYSYDTNGNMHCVFEEVKSEEKTRTKFKTKNFKRSKRVKRKFRF